ncbi:MAG: MaoC family dehydratase [Alphaproteobacteria bacterium]|nr:MaoC family dehydratase [Pseudomonadota bacterium]
MEGPFLEDFEAGQRYETAGKTLAESEILEFALRYDPQPFHMDVTAAEQSIYGGLIASGIQTLAVALRMVVQSGLFSASMGSPGVDELRWLKPVRPGDTIRTVLEVLKVRPSESKPDRGVVTLKYETMNQNNEVVMTFRALQMIRRRGDS